MIALQVANLSKWYRLYDSGSARIRALLFGQSNGQVFHALQDVNFNLAQGGTLGLIGDNGAGKSTLLQLIAGALTPSAGHIIAQGQVLGLLELGVGFHPEFTGRENVYFYADILGLSRAKVRTRFAEIAAFSELGDFIERPLKTYSTGMRMRLAFSLVATLDPDILLIDEALAVGDLHFQKKCIDRMMEIKARGRTIIFCSHSTYQISQFCDEVLWIKEGRIEQRGEPATVVPRYEAYQAQKDSLRGTSGFTQHLLARITELRCANNQPLRPGDDLIVRVRIACTTDELAYHLTLSLKLDNGRGVFVTGTHLTDRPPLRGYEREVLFTFPKIPLMGGVYSLHARVFDDQGLILYHESTFPALEMIKVGRELGICRLECRWEIR